VGEATHLFELKPILHDRARRSKTFKIGADNPLPDGLTTLELRLLSASQ
jgi:hypothetical protein